MNKSINVSDIDANDDIDDNNYYGDGDGDGDGLYACCGIIQSYQMIIDFLQQWDANHCEFTQLEFVKNVLVNNNNNKPIDNGAPLTRITSCFLKSQIYSLDSSFFKKIIESLIKSKNRQIESIRNSLLKQFKLQCRTYLGGQKPKWTMTTINRRRKKRRTNSIDSNLSMPSSPSSPSSSSSSSSPLLSDSDFESSNSSPVFFASTLSKSFEYIIQSLQTCFGYFA